MTLPAIDNYATYGGNKIDYSPVEDPSTDLSADEGNQCRASTAAMTRTAPRIIIKFTTLAGVGTVVSWDSVYGNAFADTPLVIQGIVGVWVIAMPASVTDFVGTEQTLNLRYAHGEVESLSNRWTAQCKVTLPNTVQVAIFNSAGTLADPDTVGGVVVWVY